MTHQLTRRLLLTGLGAAGLGACASLPTSGPAEQVAASRQPRATTGVQVAAQSPVAGGDPELILGGFLAAMIATDKDYATARAYLSPAAQKIWSPAAGTTIYDGEASRTITTPTTASINAPVVGRLDGQGRFMPSRDRMVHDFGMVRVKGEWRIGRPPEGILIARYAFERYYRALNVHFLGSAGTRYALETVHRPADLTTANEAMRALLSGPSAWLAPALVHAIPADTRMNVAAVVVRDGIAEVSLTDTISSLNPRQRAQAAAQVVGTLTELDDITGVRILSNGQPWQVPGAAEDGTLGPEAFTAFALLDGRDAAQALGIRRSIVGEIDPTAAGGMRLVSGPLGIATWGDQPGSLGLDRSGTVAAVVNKDATKLYRSGVTAGAVTPLASGEKLLRPQVLDDLSIWTIDAATKANTLIAIDRDDHPTRLVLDELTDMTVLAFRVSPDRSRIALAVRRGQQGVLGLMRVRGGMEGTTVDGWRELPLSSGSGPLSTVLDVGWASPDAMVVLAGIDSDDYRSIFRVAADGSAVENLGPSGSGGAPQQLSVFPRRLGTSALYLTDQQEAFSFEGAYRWQKVLSECSHTTFPG